MIKVSKSLLRGAKEALNYAKGNKKSSKTYQVKLFANRKSRLRGK